MSHRGRLHARRRVYAASWRETDDVTGASLLLDWDETTWDDVLPAHARRIPVEDDGGDVDAHVAALLLDSNANRF